DGELQWVVVRAGRLAEGAAEVLGPRLEFGGVQGVGHRPHLENDRVQFQLDTAVEQGEQLGLLAVGGEPFLRGPVDVGDGGDPDATELARRRGRRVARWALRQSQWGNE